MYSRQLPAKSCSGEQRVEHRLAISAARACWDRVSRGVDESLRLSRSLARTAERRRRCSVGAAEQGVDTGGQRRGDVGDIGGPLFNRVRANLSVDDARVD